MVEHVLTSLFHFIQHPALQSAFPGSLNMTVLRTLDGSQSPIPNTTSFGEPGSLFFQIWYEGVEQAYCSARECYVHTTTEFLFTEWNCHKLSCTCREGTTMCGGSEVSGHNFQTSTCPDIELAPCHRARIIHKQSTTSPAHSTCIVPPCRL